jgi:hypothetical protein
MTNDNVSYRSSSVSTNRTAGLRYLLRYALSHQYARGWIAPLTCLLQREGT